MPLMEEVEMARRLVEEEHSRLLGEGAREQRALALPARERVDRVIAELEDARPAPSPPGPVRVLRRPRRAAPPRAGSGP